MPNPAALVKSMLNVSVKRAARLRSAWTTARYTEDPATAYTYVYTPPVNIRELPAVFAQQYNHDVVIKPHRIYYLSNVFATWQGMVFRNLKVFLPSLMEPALVSYFQEPVLLKQWYGARIRVQEESGVAIAHNQYAHTNYYHWLIDTLPRLLILRKHHPNVPLVIRDTAPAFVTETATTLGFQRFIRAHDRQVLQIDKLILPDEHAAPLGHNDPKLIKQVREELLAKLGTPDTVPHKRLYVSRERQRVRKARNQAELDVLLRKYDFETVYFEGLTLREQIKTMQEAAIVVSVHGANLVNCIFLKEGTPLVELQSITLSNPAYWRLCSALSLPYYVLACETTEPEPISHHSNSDIIVDLEKLEAILHSLV
jgi:hypothetical protein